MAPSRYINNIWLQITTVTSPFKKIKKILLWGNGFFFVSMAVLSEILFISSSGLTSTKYIDALCQHVENGTFCMHMLRAYPPAVTATDLVLIFKTHLLNFSCFCFNLKKKRYCITFSLLSLISHQKFTCKSFSWVLKLMIWFIITQLFFRSFGIKKILFRLLIHLCKVDHFSASTWTLVGKSFARCNINFLFCNCSYLYNLFSVH